MTIDSDHDDFKHWQQCTDVYDFLHQIRLRPGLWLRKESLHDLQSILVGYRVALGVHDVEEPFPFWPENAFTDWLHEQKGMSSSLGWAAEITRTTPDGATPLSEFFRLLDAYRAQNDQQPSG
ncbi:hypothetical protein ACFWZ2_41050 [Streptomyces sp. NPDC059002]|uniref:hypothetical protein n=1 Tax=Streptomyces sp. NPDC059002 TaxID=3346690 RepID=UPI0036A7D2A9